MERHFATTSWLHVICVFPSDWSACDFLLIYRVSDLTVCPYLDLLLETLTFWTSNLGRQTTLVEVLEMIDEVSDAVALRLRRPRRGLSVFEMSIVLVGDLELGLVCRTNFPTLL